MCHIEEMLKRLTYVAAAATAVAFGAMPTATAQTETAEEGTPFAITFNGNVTPANLEAVDYPFTAATLNRNGECLLNVMTDEHDTILGMSVLTCTDDLFRAEAEDLIQAQTLPSELPASLNAHALRISWQIGEEIAQTPMQLVSN